MEIRHSGLVSSWGLSDRRHLENIICAFYSRHFVTAPLKPAGETLHAGTVPKVFGTSRQQGRWQAGLRRDFWPPVTQWDYFLQLCIMWCIYYRLCQLHNIHSTMLTGTRSPLWKSDWDSGLFSKSHGKKGSHINQISWRSLEEEKIIPSSFFPPLFSVKLWYWLMKCNPVTQVID